jgi:integrase
MTDPAREDDRLDAEEATLAAIDRALDAGVGKVIDRLVPAKPESDDRAVRTPGVTMTAETEFGDGVLDAAVLRRARRDADRIAGAAPRRPARPLLATLIFAGPRIDEALSLRWRDVDLAGGRLRINGTKTDAAARTVEILPALRDELLAYAAGLRTRDPNALVFGTTRAGGRYDGGGKHSASNIRNRVLAKAVESANAKLTASGSEPLPDGLTPHSLRRTFASLLVALDGDPAVVMRQMGHASPQMTLGVYAAAMDWAEGERDRLRALVDGVKWQETGSSSAPTELKAQPQRAA